MAVSDRLAVMKDGIIQHIGTPRDVYHRPANLFVSTFIGRTNVLKAQLAVAAGNPVLQFPGGFRGPLDNVREDSRTPQKVLVSIRPEEFVISTVPNEGLRAVVDSSTFLGQNTHHFVHLDSEERVEIIQESRMDETMPPGHEVFLTVKPGKINVFTLDGSRNILTGVRNDRDANEGA